jgi:subtilase family serine protease
MKYLASTVKFVLFAVLLKFCSISVTTSAQGLVRLPAQVPPAVARLIPQGRVPATNRIHLAIGLPLRNEEALHSLLKNLYDPAGTQFHQFLTPQEFTARFGPTETDYQAAIRFAEANGLTVSERHPNRVVLDVEGNARAIEKAFHVTLSIYRHPTEARDFFAPDSEPSVPSNLSVVTIDGLSDYALPRPLSHRIDPLKIRQLGGSGPSGYYAGNDFRNAYAPGTALDGSGQAVGLLEFSAYFASDITNYENTIGMTNYVPLNTIVIGHPAPTTANNAEVALDIEVAIAMAPRLAQVIVYEARSSPSSLLSRMANDNLAKQLSSSWSWSGGPDATIDSILQQMAAQGQSFFQASGDSDAYTGPQTLDNSSQTTAPVDSTNVTCVGGTTLTMNGSGLSWSSEKVWNYHSFGGANANIGSGGGTSIYYTIPYWQTNVSMSANSGSTTFRNVPDVALTADGVYVAYNNGSSGGFAGTSCAAPLWAGFCALVNQQSLTVSGTTVGFLNPALYAIAKGPNYANCFHDTTTGNNIGTNTPGLFNAVTGYDLATGLGTPNGTNLINALAPALAPLFVTQPASKTVTNGASLNFSASVSGQSPLFYQWLFNGTNLPSGGNVSGTTSSVLSLTSVLTNNAGNYQLIASNSFGAVTSSIAVLTVGFPPLFTAQPVGQTVLTGSNAIFSATVSGSAPLVYQWRKNGTNVANNTSISGATSNVLTLTSVTTNSSGNYTLFATNAFGTSTSSVATLNAVVPPGIASFTGSQTIECGVNASFNASAVGTAPLSYQWSLDGSPISGATVSSFSLTNVHLPNHAVGLVVTNLYGSTSSNVVLNVQDTIAPSITMAGSNLVYAELGSSFIDPGATANDICMGSVAVSTNGAVNISTVGTNTIVYKAGDGNGNTNSVSRTVVIRDTTAPTILWSFTNLVVAAGTNCSAPTPDVTGTNFILATDLSDALTIIQSPTNGFPLPLGTNLVVITVEDASSNAAYSTNFIVVLDQTPPLILNQPQNETNFAGTDASFSVSASACTPLSYQWWLNSAALVGQTNNTITINSVSPANAGDYSVVITAASGSTTSTVATLTVNLVSSVLSLNASSNPAGFRDALNFLAGISPTNANGTISFLTNGVSFDIEPLVGGQAISTNLVSLPRGTNLITAIYSGDVNDLPATNSLDQIVTNHPPVAASVSYFRQAGAGLNIAVADLATNWTDVDGDTVSLSDVSVSTNGVTLTNNAGTLIYSNANDEADEFVCAISDGWGGTNFQTVNITINSGNGSNAIITSVSANLDGSFTLTFAGTPGASYVLETTTNLSSPSIWLPTSTNTAETNGVWQFQDLTATNYQQRFYRLVQAP